MTNYSRKLTVICPNCKATTDILESKQTSRCEYCGGAVENPYYEDIIRQKNEQKKRKKEQETFNPQSVMIDAKDYNANTKNGVYAYIEKKGLFFNGVIPGLTFGEVRLCNTFDECFSELREKYYKNRGGIFDKTSEQNLEKIIAEHPYSKIIRID